MDNSPRSVRARASEVTRQDLGDQEAEQQVWSWSANQIGQVSEDRIHHVGRCAIATAIKRSAPWSKPALHLDYKCIGSESLDTRRD